jgi:hypothetical protein
MLGAKIEMLPADRFLAIQFAAKTMKTDGEYDSQAAGS